MILALVLSGTALGVALASLAFGIAVARRPSTSMTNYYNYPDPPTKEETS